MVITSEGRSGPDIWPETPNQASSTKDIILTAWSKDNIKQKEINSQQQHPLCLSPREACYTSYTSSNEKNSYLYPFTDI